MRQRKCVGPGRGRLISVGFLMVACLVAFAPVAHSVESDVVVRVFRVEHAKVSEISAAVQLMLSDEGSLTVEPAKSRLTVRDRPDVMVGISQAVERLDRKPSPFRLHVELLEGSNVPISAAGNQDIGQRLKKMFPFKFYRKLGSADLGGATGDEIAVKLKEGFRVSVVVLDHRLEPTPFGIPTQNLRLDLRPLVLERVNSEGTIEVLRTRVVLSENQEVVIGAGETEDSKQGLVLIIKALPVG